jgi:outer membrane protein assembly factor BamB
MGTVLRLSADAAAQEGFRGPAQGWYANEKPATHWSATSNVVWKARLPGWSNGSPVPAGDVVFVCAEPFTLLCLRARDGQAVWQVTNDYRQVLSPEQSRLLESERAKAQESEALLRKARERFEGLARELSTAEDREKVKAQVADATGLLVELGRKWEPTPVERKFRLPPTHGATGYTTATPVSDGVRVWAMFGNGVCACYEMDGRRRWIRDLERPTQGHGHTASPVLAAGKLVVTVNDIHILDASTGEPVARVPAKPRFGTPVVTRSRGVVLLMTADGQAVDLAAGKSLVTGLSGPEFNSPVADSERVYFFDGDQARAFALPAGDAIAETKPDGGKPARKVEPVWRGATAKDRYYSSPVCGNGAVCGLNARGVLTVLDAKTGQKVVEKDLKTGGTCYPSLSMVGSYLFATSDQGLTVVLDAAHDYAEVARNSLGAMRSSLAFAGNRVYVRTMDTLFCIGAAN